MAEPAAQIEELRWTLEWAKRVICTSPLPLRCPMCKQGNMGIGLSFCAINQALRNTKPTEANAAAGETR